MAKFSILIIVSVLFFTCNTKTKESDNKETDQKMVKEEFYLYVGTYTESDDEGIGIYKFDAGSGQLTFVAIAKGIENPSYLAIHPDKKLLIAVNEVVEFEGQSSGAVSSFAIDTETGQLRFINQVPSGGGAPCYVSIDKAGDKVFVANYVDGNVSLFPVEDDGQLGKYTDLVQHEGIGPNSSRQESPHAHSIVLEQSETYAMAVDLGIDKVFSYQIGADSLVKANEFIAQPGAGPRHIVFHQNEKLAFIINELNSTITSCQFDASSGALTEIMNVGTLPENFEGENSCADIHISKDGNFLYGSNRGDDSIVIFAINQETGALTYVGHQSVKGQTPRNFMIDPTGDFLLVANQNSNNIVVFKIDQVSGLLSETGIEVEIPRPVCLKMMKI